MSKAATNVQRMLISAYREALEGALEIDHSQERIHYLRHKEILDELESLLANSANTESIQTLLGKERRSFGWTYLSGDHGSRVESAFNALANGFEDE